MEAIPESNEIDQVAEKPPAKKQQSRPQRKRQPKQQPQQQQQPKQPAPPPSESEFPCLKPTAPIVVEPGPQGRHEREQEQEDAATIRGGGNRVLEIPVEEGDNPCEDHHHHKGRCQGGGGEEEEEEEEEEAAAARAAESTPARGKDTRGRKAGAAASRKRSAAAAASQDADEDEERIGGGRRRRRAGQVAAPAQMAEVKTPPTSAAVAQYFPSFPSLAVPAESSSVVRFLESPQPGEAAAAATAMVEEGEEGVVSDPTSAEEQRRWLEWDEHGFQHGLLMRHDGAFQDEIHTWDAGRRPLPVVEVGDEERLAILPPPEAVALPIPPLPPPQEQQQQPPFT